MFDFVRKHTKIMMFLMFLLIIPAFVLVGINGFKRLGSGGDTVAKVGSYSVKQGEWDASHKNEVDRVRSTQPNVDPKLLDSADRSAVAIRDAKTEIGALRKEHDQLVAVRGQLERTLRESAEQAADALRAANTDAADARLAHSQLVAEHATLQTHLREQLDRAMVVEQQFVEEREQLTRVLHAVTGRCDATDAELRRIKAELRGSEERNERDSATIDALRVEHRELTTTIERLQTEQRALATVIDEARSRLLLVESTLSTERAAAVQQADIARTEHTQLLATLDTERHRSAGLDREVTMQKALVEQWSALQRSLESDHKAVLHLRETLVQFLGDADYQYHQLLERQEVALNQCDRIQGRSAE